MTPYLGSSGRRTACPALAALGVIGIGTGTCPAAHAGADRFDGPIYGSVLHPLVTTANGFATGDVNADGWADVVAVSGWATSGQVRYFSNVVGVGLGDGLPVLTCVNPQEALLVDVNADERDDLVVACPQSGGVYLLHSVSWGSFASPILILSGTSPQSVAAGDLDGDGFPELAVANGGDATVALLRNVGPGYFLPWILLGTEANPTSVRLADLDQDGDLDVLCGHESPDAQSVSWWRSDAGGVFVAQAPIALCPSPRSIRIGDLDGDGMLDLAAIEPAGAAMWTVRRGSDGEFLAPVAREVGPDPRDLRLGDLDADGNLDAVVGVAGDGRVVMLLNQGTGELDAPIPAASASKGTAVELLDVDLDGHLDLLHARDWGASWMELLPRQNASFLAAIELAISPPLPGIAGIALSDVDLDGDLDLVLAGANEASSALAMTVTFNDGGAFLRTSVYPFTANSDATSVTVADLDADGAVDVVVAYGNGAKIWHGDGGGGFVGPATLLLSSFGNARFVYALDLDEDDDLDLIVPDGYAGTSLWRQTTAGAFELAGSLATSESARIAAIADFDGDAVPDLAIASWSSIVVHRNLGAFAFELLAELPQVVGGNVPIFDLAAADLDGDGDVDLGFVAASASLPGRFDVLLNECGRFVQEDGFYEEKGGGSRLLLHDMNGDGVIDALIGRGTMLQPPYGARLALRFGDGDGTFGLASLHAPVTTGTVRAALGDINGDGAVDIVLASSLSAQPTLLLSRRGCSADLDRDGEVGSTDLELLLGAWGQGGATDLDGDGVTGAGDVGTLLGRWGPCPELCSDC